MSRMSTRSVRSRLQSASGSTTDACRQPSPERRRSRRPSAPPPSRARRRASASCVVTAVLARDVPVRERRTSPSNERELQLRAGSRQRMPRLPPRRPRPRRELPALRDDARDRARDRARAARRLGSAAARGLAGRAERRLAAQPERAVARRSRVAAAAAATPAPSRRASPSPAAPTRRTRSPGSSPRLDVVPDLSAMTLGSPSPERDTGTASTGRARRHDHLQPRAATCARWSDVVKKKLAGLDTRTPDRRRRRRLCSCVGFAGAHASSSRRKAPRRPRSRRRSTPRRRRSTSARPTLQRAPASRRRSQVADLFKLSRAMPDRSDMPGIILTLSQVAREAGISFQLIEPVAVAPVDTDGRRLPDAAHPFALRRRLLRAERLPLPPAQPRRVHDGKLAATGRCSTSTRSSSTSPQDAFPQHLRRAVRERVRLPAPRRLQQRRTGTTTDPGTTTPPRRDTTAAPDVARPRRGSSP